MVILECLGMAPSSREALVLLCLWLKFRAFAHCRAFARARCVEPRALAQRRAFARGSGKDSARGSCASRRYLVACGIVFGWGGEKILQLLLLPLVLRLAQQPHQAPMNSTSSRGLSELAAATQGGTARCTCMARAVRSTVQESKRSLTTSAPAAVSGTLDAPRNTTFLPTRRRGIINSNWWQPTPTAPEREDYDDYNSFCTLRNPVYLPCRHAACKRLSASL